MSPNPEVGCWKSAWTMVWMCGIDVSSTTNGQVQPALLQIQRYSSHAPTSVARTATTVVPLTTARRKAPMAQVNITVRVAFMPLDPARAVAELRELRELTEDENGAQRVAWTDTWEQARE